MDDQDSDFYGDEETVKAMEAQVSRFDPDAWWATHGAAFLRQPAIAQATSTQVAPSDKTTSKIDTSPPARATPLYNPLEGDPMARQLSETVPEFVARLPPSRTRWHPSTPWIRIANPHLPRDDSNGPLLHAFCHGGGERLALLSQFTAMANKSTAPRSAVADMAKERDDTVRDLLELAVMCNILEGKWMLFPSSADVDEVWAKVATATANGTLGPAAKVETIEDLGKKECLICVYTRDWRDKNDIARVLQGLKEIGLVAEGGKPIYYKTDAWTYLNIYGHNAWQIKASMYSSSEIFRHLKNLPS